MLYRLVVGLNDLSGDGVAVIVPIYLKPVLQAPRALHYPPLLVGGNFYQNLLLT